MVNSAEEYQSLLTSTPTIRGWQPGFGVKGGAPFRTFSLRILFLLVCLFPDAGLAKSLRQEAVEMKAKLTGQILPYWFDTTVDHQNGGFILADAAGPKPPPAREKQLVTQARLIWSFAHVHRKGYGAGERYYLNAAQQGYQFLVAHFLDQEHGGYFWKTDLAGRPIDQRKFLYGQAFVIYAFVELYRATGDRDPMQRALDLFQKIQAKCHDPVHGGWIEHAERDFTPIPGNTAHNRVVEVEVAGLRSANAHLHWMEALTELFETWPDASVRNALREVLKINATYFYPPNPGESRFHRMPDWSLVPNDPSPGISYGHNVEFAWLMIRAEKILLQKPSWSHFEAIMNHSWRYGCDQERGGLYNRGSDNAPATDRDKVWWVQAEWLAALTDGLTRRKSKVYVAALEKLLKFIHDYQEDTDGVWLDTVTAEGGRKNPAKAHHWKANYHDVRAMVKFLDAYLPRTRLEASRSTSECLPAKGP